MSLYRIFSWALVSLILVGTMHPIQALLGLNIKMLFVLIGSIIVFLFLVRSFEEKKLYKKDIVAIIIALLFFAIGAVGSLVSGSFHQLLSISIAFFSLLFLFSDIFRIFNHSTIKLLTDFTLLLLFSCLLSLIYALAGGESTYSVINPETGKDIQLYLFSFTNSVIGNIIRPSGFFDEPGALAMFVSYVSILIVLSSEEHHKTKLVGIILCLAMVTFSLMIVIALILFLIFLNEKKISIRNILFITTILSTLGFILNRLEPELLYSLLFSRFEIIDGVFAGDNRSDQLFKLIRELNSEIILSGYQVLYGNYNDGDIASGNPLSILFTSGIFVFLPYFFIQVFLLLAAIISNDGKLKYSAFLLFLTLLQRPYIYSLYWGILTMVIIIFIARRFIKSIYSVRDPHNA